MMPLPSDFFLLVFFYFLIYLARSDGKDCKILSSQLICTGTADLPSCKPNEEIKVLDLKDFTLLRLERRFFRNLPRLQIFTAANLGIETIDNDTFVDTKELSRVTLFNNKIAEIDSDIFSGSEIKGLTIYENTGHIIKIERPFLNSQSLTLLSLNACGLRVLSSETFDLLPNLVTLDLSKNQLTGLPDLIFKYNKDLTTLNLENNEFITLSPASFNSKPAFSVYLANNPWDCEDCRLTHLILWAQRKSAITSIYDFKCKNPKNTVFSKIENPPLCWWFEKIPVGVDFPNLRI